MERLKKLIRYACANSFGMCASIFYTAPLPKESKAAAPHPAEEYEIIRDQSKNELKPMAEGSHDERWVADFESWSKKKPEKKVAEPKKDTIQEEGKKNLAGVDEEAIIKEKNIIDDKAADMFAEMEMAPSFGQKMAEASEPEKDENEKPAEDDKKVNKDEKTPGWEDELNIDL